MPVHWTAPESLMENNHFSLQTDIWCMCVCMFYSVTPYYLLLTGHLVCQCRKFSQKPIKFLRESQSACLETSTSWVWLPMFKPRLQSHSIFHWMVIKSTQVCVIITMNVLMIDSVITLLHTTTVWYNLDNLVLLLLKVFYFFCSISNKQTLFYKYSFQLTLDNVFRYR